MVPHLVLDLHTHPGSVVKYLQEGQRRRVLLPAAGAGCMQRSDDALLAFPSLGGVGSCALVTSLRVIFSQSNWFALQLSLHNAP
jgi:hypothetical protein